MKRAIGPDLHRGGDLPATPPVNRTQVDEDAGVVLSCSRRERGGAHCVALFCSTQTHVPRAALQRIGFMLRVVRSAMNDWLADFLVRSVNEQRQVDVRLCSLHH
jgi:hypothetical protein